MGAVALSSGIGSVDNIINKATALATKQFNKFVQLLIDKIDWSTESAQKETLRVVLKQFTSKKADSLVETIQESLEFSALFGAAEVGIDSATVELKDWSILPFAEAIRAFKKRKILTDKQFKTLEDSAKRSAFTAGSLLEQYAAETVHSTLTEALENGISQSQAIKNVKEALETAGVTDVKNYHIERVFRTNVLQSYQDGRFTQMQRVKSKRPYWQYSTAGDERVRPEHAELDGVVYAADDPFWSTWYPPNGFSCRCTVFTLSQEDVDEEGLEVQTKMPDSLPDKGFRSSPATKKADNKKLDNFKSQLDKLPGYKGPKLNGNTSK